MSRWPIVPLSEVIETADSGFACSKTKLTSDGLAHLRPFNIGANGELDLGEIYRVPVAEAPTGKRSLRAGDILFNNTNSIELVGKSALVERDLEAGFSNHLTRVRLRRDRMLPAFAILALGVLWRTGFFQGRATQWVSQAAFNGNALAQVPVPLPPLDEQRRIVDLLNRAAGIRRLREAALSKAREAIPALFLSMFGDPATNPKGWPMLAVGEAGRVQLGRQRAPKYQTGTMTKPYVRVANVYEDRIDLTDLLSMDFDASDCESYRLRPGDILLNEGQSIELVGRPAMWRGELEGCCFQNTLVRFQAADGIIDPEFALAHFLWFFRHGAFSHIASKTSNVAHLGAGRFARMRMMVPPLDKQSAFAARALDLRAIIAQQERALGAAQEMEAALLHRLLD